MELDNLDNNQKNKYKTNSQEHKSVQNGNVGMTRPPTTYKRRTILLVSIAVVFLIITVKLHLTSEARPNEQVSNRPKNTDVLRFFRV